MQKLTPEHVQSWHGVLLKTLSPRTVHHAHRVLSLALKNAVKNGTLARNVAAVHKPPSVEQRELEILSQDQIADVRKKIENHPLCNIVSLALATGMRRGEILALEWGDIDFNSGTVRVERSVEETKAGLRVKPPKTKRGRRNITLPPDTVAMLREHRKKQIELRLALGQGGQPSLVFSTIEGGLLSPDNLSRDWIRLCRAKKLPRVSFHSLRHTHASILIAAGVDILAISRRLGHAKAAITLDVYGHLMQGADKAAADAIADALK